MSIVKGLSINADGKLDCQLDERMFKRSSDDVISLVGMESIHAYGVEWDDNVADPDCVRIGNMDLHRTLPVQSLMRGCLLDDNGNVVMYLPEDDWTSSVRDGSMGQVMVEMPRHYRKFVTEGTKHQVWLSLYPIDGYHEVPKMYVGAYEAAVQRSTSKLCSVSTYNADYAGGDAIDSNMYNKPATNFSLTQFRQMARNRNQAITEWNCYTYECHKAIVWLFVVEYATRNSQKGFNAQPTAEGYKQGGLGEGVTTISGDKWNSYNGYRPFVGIDATDVLGNKSGVVYVNFITELGNFYIPRYRGIEHPFGHIWKWVDGVLCFPNSDGTQLHMYTFDNPADFNDGSSTTGGKHMLTASTSSGYIAALAGGEIMPSALGASSSTYWCDYYYTASGAYTRGVLFGGLALAGADAGLAFSTTDTAPSHAHTHFGSRLCFIPR